MDNKLIECGANIIAFRKNNINYGMCCAWAMMTDYDKILCLLGSQSVTGKNINKGDIIGVSALSINQEKIAYAIGDKHSDEVDKFKNIKYKIQDSAILIEDSSRMMVVEVIDVLHLQGIESDNLVYGKVINVEKNDIDFYQFK